MTKVSARYKFERIATTSTTTQLLFVILEINYEQKNYTIYNEKNNTTFRFSTSRTPEIWFTVLECIEDAVRFAETELKSDIQPMPF